MTDNGNGKEVVKVMLKDGKMNITFGNVNMAVISHALRLASLELDNEICAAQTSTIVKPNNNFGLRI